MSDSASQRLVFVHIMKTGGLGLSHRLRESFDPDRAYPRLADPDVTKKIDVGALVALGSRRDDIDFFTLHMPAWVLDEILPDSPSLVVLREPVERTVSHLHHITRLYQDGRSLEEVYDEPLLHDRLVNYQTHVLSLGRDDHGSDADPHRSVPDGLSDDELAALRQQALPYLATALPDVGTADSADLARALATLHRFSIVGTTDRLQSAADAAAGLLGVPERPLSVRNQNPVPQTVQGGLLERIAADNRLDAQLYAAALDASS